MAGVSFGADTPQQQRAGACLGDGFFFGLAALGAPFGLPGTFFALFRHAPCYPDLLPGTREGTTVCLTTVSLTG